MQPAVFAFQRQSSTRPNHLGSCCAVPYRDLGPDIHTSETTTHIRHRGRKPGGGNSAGSRLIARCQRRRNMSIDVGERTAERRPNERHRQNGVAAAVESHKSAVTTTSRVLRDTLYTRLVLTPASVSALG